MTRRTERTELMKGTLDLLILRTLALEARHGVGIADRVKQVTGGTFVVPPGSLFPALHRLEARDLIAGEWGQTAEGHRARFYRLTPRGRRELDAGKRQWQRIVLAMEQVLESNG